MKMIIIMAVLSVVSFAGAFFLTQWLGGSPPPPPQEAGAPVSPQEAELAKIEKLTPKEHQLEELIREVRAKLEELRRRERELDERARRVRIAEEMVNQTAKDAQNLSTKLTASVMPLQEAVKKLEQTRVVIEREEMANLKRQAKYYEGMKPVEGAKVLQEMCRGKQFDDAVKILTCMKPKSVSKLLENLTDRALPARILERMKRLRIKGEQEG